MWLKTLSSDNVNKPNIATYSVIAATVVMVVIAQALVQSASAILAPKAVETEECSEEKFAKLDGCPGKSADSSGIGETGEREEETVCTARNQGQANKECPASGHETIVVNPPQQKLNSHK